MITPWDGRHNAFTTVPTKRTYLSKTTHEPKMSDAIVSVRDLRKTYLDGDSRREILTHATFDLAPGSFNAVIGPSGCGKSTLLNLVCGIDTPDGGEVRIGGQTMSGLDETGRTLLRRRQIGLVFQFFNLLPTLTVWENIFLPIQLNGLDAREGTKRLERLLDVVGLRERRNEFPEHLSGGEQQRAAILRALAHEPVLILADEPTGNLDRDAGTRVIAEFTRLARAQNTTLLIATHSDELVRAADTVFRIENHTVVRNGD